MYFRQIYIEVGVEFPFSFLLHHRLSEVLTPLIDPSPVALQREGGDFQLTFTISAKRGIEDNEIAGPSIFKKTKDIEYTIFLPYEAIIRTGETPKTALHLLFRGLSTVLDSLGICTSRIRENEKTIIDQICSNPKYFKNTNHTRNELFRS